MPGVGPLFFFRGRPPEVNERLTFTKKLYFFDTLEVVLLVVATETTLAASSS